MQARRAPLRVQRVFGFTKAEVEVLAKQLPALNRAAITIETAQVQLARGSTKAAEKQARQAWAQVKSLAAGYGQSKRESRQKIARKIRRPFTALQSSGLDIGLPAPVSAVARRSSPQPATGQVCPRCQLQLTAADTARGGTTHDDC
ncbi:MAG: hypothetical protein LCI03_07370 [Actinobacteria bacterium]|nr:hypothetical protein [Actinomycetota bacterium]